MSPILMLFGCLLLSIVSCRIATQNSYNSITENEGKFKFPTSMEECVEFIVHPSYPKEFVQTVQSHCLDGFISIDHTHNWAANFTKDEQMYIGSLFRKIISDASSTNNVRRKRNADPLFPRRLRREVRAAPYSNWLNYARNVRRLKYDTILPNGRSRWDIIADLHRIAVNSAHFGPNFLPWHRLYLIVMETALGTPIPYWQSTLDFDMADPTQTILFTERYFGNGFGLVKTGPFSNFNTPRGRLFRQIGADGSLFTRDGINLILMQMRLAEISEPTAVQQASLEGQHNGIHIWVDGLMNDLEYSPHDPVFFTHHAFVDFMWEMFRTEQKRRNINPELDTVAPPPDVSFQNVTDPAVALTGYYNNDGYSEVIAALVHYLPVLSCPSCGNSPDVVCDFKRDVCVSKPRDPREYMGNPEEAMASVQLIVQNGLSITQFPIYFRDVRVRMDSLTLNYDDPTAIPQSVGVRAASNENQQIVSRTRMAMNGQTSTIGGIGGTNPSIFHPFLVGNGQLTLRANRQRLRGSSEPRNTEHSAPIKTSSNHHGYTPFPINQFFENVGEIPWNNIPEHLRFNVRPSAAHGPVPSLFNNLPY